MEITVSLFSSLDGNSARCRFQHIPTCETNTINRLLIYHQMIEPPCVAVISRLTVINRRLWDQKVNICDTVVNDFQHACLIILSIIKSYTVYVHHSWPWHDKRKKNAEVLKKIKTRGSATAEIFWICLPIWDSPINFKIPCLKIGLYSAYLHYINIL